MRRIWGGVEPGPRQLSSCLARWLLAGRAIRSATDCDWSRDQSLGRYRFSHLANDRPEPDMRRVCFHSRVPGHQVLECPEYGWWLDDPPSRVGILPVRH